MRFLAMLRIAARGAVPTALILLVLASRALALAIGPPEFQRY